MINITLYEKNTGNFGPILSGHSLNDLTMNIPNHLGYVFGSYNRQKYKYNVDTSQIDSVNYTAPVSWDDIRDKRDKLLNYYSWTVLPASPLSNQSAFIQYLSALHKLTINYTAPELVIFPEVPGYEYGE